MRYPMPAQPQELTPAFLSELVSELRPGVRVEAADIVGLKQYGEADNAISISTSTRVTLEVRYNREAPESLPTRLLVKMSLPPEIWVAHLDALFENEVTFYNRLRPELNLETPLGLGGRFDPESKRYVLLMEDVTTRSPHINSMMDDTNLAVVQSILDTLAKLHAKYWDSPRFKTDLSWVQNQVEGSIEDLLGGLVREHIVQELADEKFKREFVEELGTTEEEMHAGVKALKRHQATFPATFLHGDTHIGNTYVLPDGTGGLFDWQVSARGFLMHDVNYFIMCSLSVAMRRKHERELLAYYRDRLCSYGAGNVPSLETLWLEHRRSMLYGLYLGWLTCPRENNGLDVLVLAHLRAAAAYQDHDTGRLISELL